MPFQSRDSCTGEGTKGAGSALLGAQAPHKLPLGLSLAPSLRWGCLLAKKGLADPRAVAVGLVQRPGAEPLCPARALLPLPSAHPDLRSAYSELGVCFGLLKPQASLAARSLPGEACTFNF